MYKFKSFHIVFVPVEADCAPSASRIHLEESDSRWCAFPPFLCYCSPYLFRLTFLLAVSAGSGWAGERSCFSLVPSPSPRVAWVGLVRLVLTLYDVILLLIDFKWSFSFVIIPHFFQCQITFAFSVFFAVTCVFLYSKKKNGLCRIE